jgi:hypothetical protein
VIARHTSPCFTHPCCATSPSLPAPSRRRCICCATGCTSSPQRPGGGRCSWLWAACSRWPSWRIVCTHTRTHTSAPPEARARLTLSPASCRPPLCRLACARGSNQWRVRFCLGVVYFGSFTRGARARARGRGGGGWRGGGRCLQISPGRQSSLYVLHLAAALPSAWHARMGAAVRSLCALRVCGLVPPDRRGRQTAPVSEPDTPLPPCLHMIRTE